MNVRLPIFGVVSVCFGLLPAVGCATQTDEEESAEATGAIGGFMPSRPVLQCRAAAFDAATFLDGLGWGKRASEPLKVVSEKRNQKAETEEFAIKSTLSGFTYTVEMFLGGRANPCVVVSVVENVENEMVRIVGKDANIQCEETALKMATHVDALGWGEVVRREPLQVVSRKRDEANKAEEFRVTSPVSGQRYTLKIRQAPKSETCFLEGLTVR